MTVAANDGHAREGDAQLRSYHVHDALERVPQPVQFHAKFCGIFGEHVHLAPAQRLFNGLVLMQGRHVVVGSSPGLSRAEYRDTPFPQPVKCLGTGYLMDKVRVDVHRVGMSRLAGHDVAVPDLVK